MKLSDELLESIAQTLAHEKALTVILPSEGNQGRDYIIRMFGADMWWDWFVTYPALIEVLDRAVELWCD